MTSSVSVALAPPRFEALGALTVTGISRRYRSAESGGIPAQWQAFAPLIPRLTDAPHPVTFGVVFNTTENYFDYLSGVCRSGVSVTNGERAAVHTVRLDIAPQTYAVFEHAGHVAQLRQSCNVIWSEWLPGSGREAVEAPWFERYGESFDPQTGNGGLEVWIPVR